MDAERFDDLTRTLAAPVRRRVFATALAGGVLAALLGGDARDATAKKRKRRKKKKPSGCTPKCAGKNCGEGDGCGRKCTVQQGCGAGETCRNGDCAPSDCTPPCTGNEICDNGSCVCPPGMKRCEGPGFFMPCHECCPNASGCVSCPAPDCEGNPNGQLCGDFDSDSVFRCTCGGNENCGGICRVCCDNDDCERKFGVGMVCTPSGGCQCQEGLSYCGREAGCRDVERDRDACGPLCMVCAAGWACLNGACCTNDCGTKLIPGMPCCNGTCVNKGTDAEPQFACE